MIVARKNPQTGETHVILTGTVCKDAKFDERYGGKASFSVKYGATRDESGKRSNGLFFNCSARRELSHLAACLEKGDSVLACGVVTTREYTCRSGEQKVWTELECDFLVPQPSASLTPEPGEAGVEGEEPEYTDESGYDDYMPSI